MTVEKGTRIQSDGSRLLTINQSTLCVPIPDERIEKSSISKRCALCETKNPYNRALVKIGEKLQLEAHERCILNNIKTQYSSYQSLRESSSRNKIFIKNIEIPPAALMESLYYRGLLLVGNEEAGWYEDAVPKQLEREKSQCEQATRKKLLQSALSFGENGFIYCILFHYTQPGESFLITNDKGEMVRLDKKLCAKRAAELIPCSSSLAQYYLIMGDSDKLSYKGNLLGKSELRRELFDLDPSNLSYNQLSFIIQQQGKDKLIIDRQGKAHKPLDLVVRLLEQGDNFSATYSLAARLLNKGDTVVVNEQMMSSRRLLIEAVNHSHLFDYRSLSELANDMNGNERIKLNHSLSHSLSKRALHILALQGFYEKEFLNDPPRDRWCDFIRPVVEDLKKSSHDFIPITEFGAIRVRELVDFLNSSDNKPKRLEPFNSSHKAYMNSDARDVVQYISKGKAKSYNKGWYQRPKEPFGEKNYIQRTADKGVIDI